MFSTHLSLFLFSLLAIPALAAPEPLFPTRTTPDARSLNPIHVLTRALAQAPAVPLTNAQRLRRGLPPNKPRARDSRRPILPRQSSTCQNQQGVIQVNIAGPSPLAGYVSRHANSFGEYQFTTDPTDALHISICQDSAPNTFDIATTNGLEDYPFFGAVVGFANTDSNFSPTSFNYAYLAGTSQAPRGFAITAPNAYSAATGISVKIESNIWKLTTTDKLVTSWVNPDGSIPAQHILYVEHANVFVITGSVSEFRSNFGEAHAATLTFVRGLAG